MQVTPRAACNGVSLTVVWFSVGFLENKSFCFVGFPSHCVLQYSNKESTVEELSVKHMGPQTRMGDNHLMSIQALTLHCGYVFFSNIISELRHLWATLKQSPASTRAFLPEAIVSIVFPYKLFKCSIYFFFLLQNILTV